MSGLHSVPSQDFKMAVSSNSWWPPWNSAGSTGNFMRSHFTLKLQTEAAHAWRWLRNSDHSGAFQSYWSLQDQFLTTDLQPIEGTVLWGCWLESWIYTISSLPCFSSTHPRVAAVTWWITKPYLWKILLGKSVVVPKDYLLRTCFIAFHRSLECLWEKTTSWVSVAAVTSDRKLGDLTQ